LRRVQSINRSKCEWRWLDRVFWWGRFNPMCWFKWIFFILRTWRKWFCWNNRWLCIFWLLRYIYLSLYRWQYRSSLFWCWRFFYWYYWSRISNYSKIRRCWWWYFWNYIRIRCWRWNLIHWWYLRNIWWYWWWANLYLCRRYNRRILWNSLSLWYNLDNRCWLYDIICITWRLTINLVFNFKSS
jgi:hypothetical protein